MRKFLISAGLALLATAALAGDGGVAIKRSVYLEQVAENGVELAPAQSLRKGDRVVLVMEWADASEAPFTLTSRIPAALAYQRSAHREVEVSVDGGRQWGRIGTLRRGDRLAAPEEVTNLRWRIARGDERGMRSFKAIVR